MRQIHRIATWLFAAILTAVSGLASAQQAHDPAIEWDKRQGAEERFRSYGPDLLGDGIDPHTGALTFQHTDVSLPGNSHLEVAVRRSRSSGQKSESGAAGGFADWDLLVPAIEVTTAVDVLWTGNRCSDSFDTQFPEILRSPGFSDPRPTATYKRHEYSNGVTLNVPGFPSQQILEGDYNGQAPAAATHVTTEGWYLKCISSIPGGGEGFYAYAPNGDRYQFDLHLTQDAKGMGSRTSVLYFLQRTKHILAATEVTDVNGNWVKYDYDASGRLDRIHANDGREIDFVYSGSSEQVWQVIANGRTWVYSYSQSDFHARYIGDERQRLTGDVLDSVLLPDLSSWQFNLDAMSASPFAGGPCVEPGVTVSVTHPYGITGTFTMAEIRHRQALGHIVQKVLVCPTTEILPIHEEQPPIWVMGPAEVMAVTSKTLSGPLIPTSVWTYTYEEDAGVAGSSSSDQTNWTKVVDPLGNHTTYYHYWNLHANGGRLAKQEIRGTNPTSAPLEIQEHTYTLEAQVGQTFAVYGATPQSLVRPLRNDETTIRRGADWYITKNTYDLNHSSSTYSFGRPTHINRYSGVSGGWANRRTETTVYEHKKSIWVLGLTKKVTRNGKVFDEYDYDSLGRMTEMKLFGDVVNEFGYHTNAGQMGALAWIDNANDDRTYLYNYHRGLARQLKRPDNVSLFRTVDNNGWITSGTNANGNKTDYQYNAVGWMTRIIPPKHNGPAADTIISYDHSGNGVVQTTTQGNYKKTVSFDGFLRPMLETQEDITLVASKRYLRTAFDVFGRATFTSYPSSASTAADGIDTSYDALGRVTQTLQNVAPNALVSYDYLVGNKTRVTDPRGNVTTTSYAGFGSPDDGGRVDASPDSRQPAPTLVDTPLDANVVTTYDDWGNVKTVTQSTAQTVYTYNNSLLVESVKDPDDYTSYTYYDELYNPLVQIDGEGRQTHTVYDVLGRPEKIIRAWTGANNGSGATLDCATMRANYNPAIDYLQQCYQAYTYTNTGKIETVTDANGNVTKYTYDALERLTHTYFPHKTSTGQWSISDYELTTFDVLSNPVSKKTRRGDTITYTHNALGELLDRRVPGAPTHTSSGRTVSHSFTYNAASSVVTATHDGETLSYDYDAIGRVSWQKHDNTRTVSYNYDAANNLTKLTYPDGWDVDFEYDAHNRIESAKDGARTLATIDYDAFSRRESVSYDNGTSVKYGYSDRGNLTCHDWNFSGTAPSACNTGSPELAYDFTHNGVGQIWTRTISNNAYVWSPTAQATDIYAVNGLNQYVTAKGTTVAYDGNGNLQTDHQGRGFTYDAENVLRTASNLSSGTASYRYHADGTRRQKTYGGNTSTFYYMGGLGYLDDSDTAFAADQEIAEYNGSTLVRRYLRLPGSVDEAFLMIEYTGSGCSSGCETWAHQNWQGSVVATTNSSGTVQEQHAYSPYGQSSPSSSSFPFRYTGQKLDAETGLYYYKARYYDPQTGRFLQTDPIGYEDQMNIYAYVGNDPANNVDPTGRFLRLAKAVFNIARRTIKNGGNLKKGIKDEIVSIADNVSTLADGQLTIDDAFAVVDLATGLGGEAKRLTGNSPVKPGDRGTYGDLKTEKRINGETEPLDMDHRPSYAAQKQAAENRAGRELTPQEAKDLKNNTPAVATPRADHQQQSRTYGGRNTKEQIAMDAQDLDKAKQLDDEAYRK